MLTAEQMFRTPFADQSQYDLFVESRTGNLTDAGETHAYLSTGRWVADCECGAGIACPPPEWGTHGACMDCGNRYRLAWPNQRDRIEGLLARRPARAQNWNGDTLDELERENVLMAHEMRN